MRRFLLALAFTGFSLGAPAWAQTPHQAYVDGAFLEAAALGETQGDADDLALAARALLAEAITGDPANMGVLLDRAETNARRALSIDPDNTEARLQLAATLGMKGRRSSIADAMRKGYAGEGHALVRAAIHGAPREAWGYALLGGWNLEVVRRGGPVGSAVFGASVEAGRASFERARALAPDDAVIAYQYAIALLELDADRYGADAARLLELASDCRTADAFEARVKAKAARVADALSDRGPQAAIHLATARFR